jgi:hypothetical protein
VTLLNAELFKKHDKLLKNYGKLDCIYMGMIYCDVLQYKMPIHDQSHTVTKNANSE